MPKWEPTPEGSRMKAERLVGGLWEPCEYSEIRKGDIFRSRDPDGQLCHIHTAEPDEDSVGLATDDARKMDPHGSDGQWYGYGVPCIVYPNIDELRKGQN
jgi:hypothetical protein